MVASNKSSLNQLFHLYIPLMSQRRCTDRIISPTHVGCLEKQGSHRVLPYFKQAVMLLLVVMVSRK